MGCIPRALTLYLPAWCVAPLQNIVGKLGNCDFADCTLMAWALANSFRIAPRQTPFLESKCELRGLEYPWSDFG